MGFSPLTFLKEKQKDKAEVSWLDICCGEGLALLQASKELSASFVGIDLVEPHFGSPSSVTFHSLPLHLWQPKRKFDLITSVHGLHYLGDKLGLISNIVSWICNDGLFVGHLDLDSCCFADGSSMKKTLNTVFNEAPFSFDLKSHLLHCQGFKEIDFGYEFLGADDKAGPNYTGQAAVASIYSRNSNH